MRLEFCDCRQVPIAYDKTTLKACLDCYKTLGDEFYEQLCSMLVFDALIYN